MNSSFDNLPSDGVIEGIVRRDASRSSRGWVTYLGPWWSHATAQLSEVPLRVRMRELDDIRRAHLTRGATVKLRCTNFEQPRAGANWWGALGVSSTLHPASARPTPILLHDRSLRTLVLDRRENAFVGRRGDRYALRIERSAGVDDRGADRREVERALATVRRCEVEMARIHAEIAARARRIYNRRWRDRWLMSLGRAPMSQDEVTRRMRLSSLTVTRDGEVHLSFSDDDMFYGGSINAILRSNLRLRLVTVSP
ncbi:MAG: DUF2262 domain-containing protein [Solirubrobacterales bacterium]